MEENKIRVEILRWIFYKSKKINNVHWQAQIFNKKYVLEHLMDFEYLFQEKMIRKELLAKGNLHLSLTPEGYEWIKNKLNNS